MSTRNNFVRRIKFLFLIQDMYTNTLLFDLVKKLFQKKSTVWLCWHFVFHVFLLKMANTYVPSLCLHIKTSYKGNYNHFKSDRLKYIHILKGITPTAWFIPHVSAIVYLKHDVHASYSSNADQVATACVYTFTSF